MKARGVIRIAVYTGLIALICATTARYATAQVAGGKHDLSFGGNANFQYFTDQVCIFCHTPHTANTTQSYTDDPTVVGSSSTLAGEFLWNRAIPEGKTWSTYTSDTMNHTVSDPGKLSLLCLSCHDGVGAMNVLLNYNWEGQPIEMPGVAINQFGDAASDPTFAALNIGEATCDGGLGTGCDPGTGTNLQNDHPVGFAYGGSAVDPGLRDIGAITDAAVRDRMQRVTRGRMECSSCHDPHRTNTGGNMFLVTSNAQSNLCFACHNK